MSTNQTDRQPNHIIALAILLALGGWLRLRFIQTAHLYPDEFVSLLAARMIAEKGWPVMPSGLFYEHGLLFSYLAAIFGQAGRYVSLGCGLLSIGLLYWVGRRWFSSGVGLMAAAGLTMAPAAIAWSGRARMYALLQLLVWVALWLAWEGFGPDFWASSRKKKNRGDSHRRELNGFLLPVDCQIHRFWPTMGPGFGNPGRAILLKFALMGDSPRIPPGLSQNPGRPPWEGFGWRRWAALATYLAATLTHFAAVALAPPLAMAACLADRRRWRRWPEALALGGILLTAFLVKRAGRPKGIDPLAADNALSGLSQVLTIYSDFSFDLWAGWQAINPFYLALPGLLFIPFILAAILKPVRQLLQMTPARFLFVILLLTTLEMMLIVSPHRRDDKYLFMLLPVLFLLGAYGLDTIIGHRLPKTIARFYPLAVAGLIVAASWPAVQQLLHDTGDDYRAAFAYVQEHWQPGDKILTGTPAAAAFYLGRSDFYCVQRRGGYDYRLLTVEGRPVDRWLASPAITTESELHRVLADHNVWLVLERWGLQREYYDLPFQQQLLAQTRYEAESQGIFILRSRADPHPLAPTPAHPVEAIFGDRVRLLGYTLEPEISRLTLYWQAVAPMKRDYTVFVHVRQPPEGGNVAQADHRPLGRLYPTSLWPAGQTIRESSPLPLDLPPGRYELWSGLYLLETGERLPVRNDTSGENAVRLGALTISGED